MAKKAGTNHTPTTRRSPKQRRYPGLRDHRGGLPRGAPSSLWQAGCGKTLLAMDSSCAAPRSSRAGCLMALRKRPGLALNVRHSLRPRAAAAENKLLVDFVHVERARSRRRASMTWKASSFGWVMRSIRSRQNACAGYSRDAVRWFVPEAILRSDSVDSSLAQG